MLSLALNEMYSRKKSYSYDSIYTTFPFDLSEPERPWRWGPVEKGFLDHVDQAAVILGPSTLQRHLTVRLLLLWLHFIQ